MRGSVGQNSIFRSSSHSVKYKASILWISKRNWNFVVSGVAA